MQVEKITTVLLQILIAYKSKQKEAKDQYETESATDDKIGRIDLEKDTLIKVTGKESIGYVLKNGEGSNKGNNIS